MKDSTMKGHGKCKISLEKNQADVVSNCPSKQALKKAIKKSIKKNKETLKILSKR